MSDQPALDQAKMEAFVHKVFGDTSAALTTTLAALGDRLGLFKDLAASGPTTSVELATRTGMHERYAREWLGGMASAGYLTYDPASQRFTLPAEHALLRRASSRPVRQRGERPPRWLLPRPQQGFPGHPEWPESPPRSRPHRSRGCRQWQPAVGRNQEATTPVWFALQISPTTFAVFDAFSDEAGRQNHLNGPIAKALMANAPTLLASAPVIERIDVLGAKLP